MFAHVVVLPALHLRDMKSIQILSWRNLNKCISVISRRKLKRRITTSTSRSRCVGACMIVNSEKDFWQSKDAGENLFFRDAAYPILRNRDHKIHILSERSIAHLLT